MMAARSSSNASARSIRGMSIKAGATPAGAEGTSTATVAARDASPPVRIAERRVRGTYRTTPASVILDTDMG
jgi:hypothetical protein